ncbi:MAG: lytic murein transglycosylase [Candidatus Moranbacteria bacterium]|nr:lytic murein transglycosylase [Candidatus Moranbacteria bacterium]
MKMVWNKKKSKVLVLLIGLAVFCVFNPYVADAADDAADIQSDMSKIEKKIDKTQQELDASKIIYNKVTVQVGATKNVLAQTAEEISRKEAEITNLNERMELHRKMLMAYLQEMYANNQDPVIRLAVANENLNDIFGNEDQALNLKEKIIGVLDEIDSSQTRLGEVKEELADKQAEHEELLQQKKAEQGMVAGDIQEAEATLAELQKKFAEMQSDLNRLLGSNYNAKDIKDAVRYASDKTGVPEGVLYGFLKKETNLGANTGQCTYKEVEKVAVARYKTLLKKNKKWQASIDLLYKRQDIFYDIVDTLGYSKTKKVSCSPSGYIGQGGAMGVSQFMSDVWRGYEARITARTGHKNPDPWSLTDGVMAMAIKLREAGATSSSESAIKKASINYLGAFYRDYYEGIVYWSKNYKKLL